MKKLLLLMIVLMASTNLWALSPTIISETGGWLESAYVKWQPFNDADSYNVYYSGDGVTDQKIDNQLIRSYGTYYRADVLGLKAGLYTLKVVPVIAGVEGNPYPTETITVEAQDRSGFAFANNRIPGAYNADGTPKSGAVIIYVTENTKNTISLNVTGATSNPCIGLQTILDGFKKGKDSRPIIIRLVGQITDFTDDYNGDIVIENDNNVSSYITFEGVGDDATADGWGIRIKNSSNIEIRNVGIMNCNSSEGDNIGLQQGNDYIWIHNVDFFYGGAGGDSDQAKGDGALDCKKSTYVTFSYNHFWDSGKCNLLGLSEGTTTGLYITYHHNWYDHSDSRHPRVRYYSAHVYNNYYDGNAKYGVGSTLGSSVFVEANFFRNCKYPILTSMQGSDVFDESAGANDYSDMPTFSKEDGGSIKAFNNSISGAHRFVPYNADGFTKVDTKVDFDAYVATTRDEVMESTIVSSRGANSYNNFDTNTSIMYAYTPDSPEDAKTNVTKYAGRILGGDFKWTFNNAVDDASYAVNSALKTSLISYKTTMVSIQGDSVSSGGGETGGGETGGGEVIEGDEVHNFTLSGKTSTFYNITGNLSDSKGTVVYGGLTLTQCLKIESSTVITFTTTEEATLTLVFNDTFSGNIKVNGASYSVTAGKLVLTLPAGENTIIKGDSANLYFMSIIYKSTGVNSTEVTKISLWPNPAETSLHITTDAVIKSIDIYSMMGVLVQSSIVANNVVHIDALAAGSYMIRIVTDQSVITEIFLKE